MSFGLRNLVLGNFGLADFAFGRTVRAAGLGLGLLGVSLLAVPRPEAALADESPSEQEPKREVDKDCVYFGNCRDFKNPAECDPDRVWAEIPEYKKILSEGLKPGDTKYDLLMTKASKRFLDAVRSAAKDGGYDLVAKLGSVRGVENVPAITDSVIGKL